MTSYLWRESHPFHAESATIKREEIHKARTASSLERNFSFALGKDLLPNELSHPSGNVNKQQRLSLMDAIWFLLTIECCDTPHNWQF